MKPPKSGRIHLTGLLLSLLMLATSQRLQAAELDITPLFAGYEHGCEITGTAEALVIWANPDDKGRPGAIDALPSLWRAHAGKPTVVDRVDHWYVNVPFVDVRFYGLRVSRFERWYGKSNGISGWALVLETSLAEARRVLDVETFRLDESENFKPELVADENSKDTHLVCDFSM